MHEYYRKRRLPEERYIDLIGLITNPIGTLLGPTGLGLGGGGSALGPGGIMAPGSELGAYASAQMAQNTQRETNAFNAGEAQKARDWSDVQGKISRDYNSAEAIAARKYNSLEADIQRNFSSAEATKNREFQAQQVLDAQKYNTMMSNSAWQRGTADMKAAGINPMLAFMQGGASAPTSAVGSGSMPSGSAASSGSASSSAPGSHSASGQQSSMAELFQKGILNSVTTAFEAQRLGKDLKLRDAEIGTEIARKENIQKDSQKKVSEKRRTDKETEQKSRDIKFGKSGALLPEAVTSGYDWLLRNFHQIWSNPWNAPFKNTR